MVRKGLIFSSWEANSTLKTASTTRFTKHRLQHLQFDLAFFGAASLSQGLVSFEDEEDVAVKQLALQTTRTKILIAESDKYEKHSKYILGKLEDFEYWITDKEPESDIVETLKDKVIILYDGKDSDY